MESEGAIINKVPRISIRMEWSKEKSESGSYQRIFPCTTYARSREKQSALSFT